MVPQCVVQWYASLTRLRPSTPVSRARQRHQRPLWACTMVSLHWNEDMTRFDIPETELRWRFDTPGGPGGQHANKTASRAELRFDIQDSRAFDEPTKNRLVAKLGSEVKIVEDGSRSQVANRRSAIRRLHALVEDAARPDPPPRRKTRPSKSARARRLREKRARAATKQQRKTPGPND